jgi:hypothetical protein
MTKVLNIMLAFLIGFLFTQTYLDSIKIYNLEQSQSVCDSLQTRVLEVEAFADSLKNEAFILETNVTRYEIALRNLEIENPKAAAEYNKYLSQTE